MRQWIRTEVLGALLLLGCASILPGAASAAGAAALSGQAAQRANAVSAPSIDAPVAVDALTNQTVNLVATATDSDAGGILTITASGAPGSLAFSHTPSLSPATASLSGLLAAGDVGAHLILWTVTDESGGSAFATTSLTVATDQAPVVSAPDSVLGAETLLLEIGVGVTDPDGDPIASLAADPLPSGATFTPNAFNTAGLLQWTPSLGQAGTYAVIFTATSGSSPLSASASTAITIGPPDRPPVITAPASVTANEGSLLTVTATVSDPDGDSITRFEASGTQNTALPAGVTFTVNASNTTGVVTWTPDFTQAGVYNLALEAYSGALNLQSIKVLKITVNNVDRSPVVTAPAAISGAEGGLLTLAVSAADPDGGAIASLTAAPLPQGATFVTNPENTSGVLSWTPSFSQEGSYSVTFTAANLLTGSATTQITVAHSNQIPALTAPPAQTVNEGSNLTFTVSAADGDGDHVALSATELPLGAGFHDNGNSTGTFDWTPGFSQSGSHTVTIAGNDGNGGIGTATTAITVHNVNRAPVSTPGGPYSGLTNVPVSFDGTGSSDPDGDALAFAWDFGDFSSGTGATPSHTYAAGGTYAVTLTVTDAGSPALSSTATTSAAITAVFEPRVYLTPSNGTIRLSSAKPTWCANVEPVGESFAIADVKLETLTLHYGGNQIGVESSKTVVVGDKDENGIDEITACFGKLDLRTLFAGLPSGRNTVTVTIEGDLVGGGRIAGSVAVDVFGSDAVLSASVSPNPLNPEATLSFSTAKSGPVRVRLYDPSGRLARTLMDESFASAGYHDVRLDGRGESGVRLASGVYFYLIETADGRGLGRLTILK